MFYFNLHSIILKNKQNIKKAHFDELGSCNPEKMAK